MSCISCGEETEESAYLCESCAENFFQQPIFFFSPNLIGDSIVERLKNHSAAMIRLGPVSGGDVERMTGQSFYETVTSFNVKEATKEDAQSFLEVANFVMSQYGIPIYADDPDLLFTEDSARVVAMLAQKVNALIARFPDISLSDVFLRMALIYWSASHSVLLRSGPVAWCREKRRYALTRALGYLNRIDESDDLYSLASKLSGFVLLDAGLYADAEERLSNARKSFPDDILLTKALAKTHFNLGNIDESIELLDEVIASNESAELWLEKGEYLRKSRRFEDAVAAYVKTITLDRNTIQAYRALIFLLRHMDRIEEANRWEAEMKLVLEPAAAAKLEELIEAQEILASETAGIRAKQMPLIKQRKPKIKREEIKDLLVASKEAVTAGNFDTAIELLKMHQAEKGKDLAGLILLGRAYLYNGQFEEAKNSIDELLRQEKNSAAGWYWRAKIAYAQGKWGAAIQHLNKATNILHSFVDAWVEKGLIFLANGQYKDADESFEVALSIDKNDARAWLGRAKAMNKLNRWGAAVQCLDRFLELMPSSREGWFLKGELLLEKNKYQDAAKAYGNYIELEPNDPRALCQRGIALQSMGLTEDAAKSFERCLELAPSNEKARNWLRTIGRR